MRQLLVNLDVFFAAFRRRKRLGSLGQILVLAETDGLRHVVFGHREVFRREAVNGIALLVFDHDRFNDKLHLHRQRVSCPAHRRLVLADLLRSRRRGSEDVKKTSRSEFAHRQNLTRIVVCRLRIGLAACGRPNCVLFTRGNPAAEDGMIQQVGCIDARIKEKVLVGPEGALHRAVEAE